MGLMSLRICTDSSEPSLLADVIIILCASPYRFIVSMQYSVDPDQLASSNHMLILKR